MNGRVLDGSLREQSAFANPLWQVADFVRTIRRRLRFGQLSRSPLQLLRLELRGEVVECEWMVRPGDAWDTTLRPRERERNISEQALRDAIRMRDLIFGALPEVETAVLRAFRPWAAREPPELVIAGVVTRDARYVFRVSSLVMRAKLYGFQFYLHQGALQRLQLKESQMTF